MKFLVNEITVNPAISIREGSDDETIPRYTDTLESLPPVVLFYTDGKYLLADGFHRLAAAKRLGLEDIEAEVREGGYEEAREYAIIANLKHGKPLTSQEYERALLRLKKMHPDWRQNKRGEVLSHSQQWVSIVFAANSLEKKPAAGKLNTDTKVKISKAPQAMWSDICHAAEEQRWTREETRLKTSEIANG